MKTRIHITVEANTIHFLNSYSKEHNSLPIGKVVDMLVCQVKAQDKAELLAERVAERVVEMLKEGGE